MLLLLISISDAILDHVVSLRLGGGVLVSRLCQFLLAAAFWIGRIDSTFLNEDVQVVGYRFDNVPIYYRTELLMHEAHRHPFIERLSAMYLMRLKHGDYFASNAGAAWRHLFVLTLMPWLLKHRQGNDPEEEVEEIDFDEYLISERSKAGGGASTAPVMIENVDRLIANKED